VSKNPEIPEEDTSALGFPLSLLLSNEGPYLPYIIYHAKNIS
jgi:hypothetical protein